MGSRGASSWPRKRIWRCTSRECYQSWSMWVHREPWSGATPTMCLRCMTGRHATSPGTNGTSASFGRTAPSSRTQKSSGASPPQDPSFSRLSGESPSILLQRSTTGTRSLTQGGPTRLTGALKRVKGGKKTKDKRQKTQDKRHKTQDTGHKTQDTRDKTQDTRHKTQDTGHKTQDTRHRTQDTRHKNRLHATSCSLHRIRLTHYVLRVTFYVSRFTSFDRLGGG